MGVLLISGKLRKVYTFSFTSNTQFIQMKKEGVSQSLLRILWNFYRNRTCRKSPTDGNRFGKWHENIGKRKQWIKEIRLGYGG